VGNALISFTELRVVPKKEKISEGVECRMKAYFYSFSRKTFFMICLSCFLRIGSYWKRVKHFFEKNISDYINGGFFESCVGEVGGYGWLVGC
jgi:hypothetical protein